MKLERVLSKDTYIRGIYHCQRCAWCRVSTYHDKGIERVCPVYENDPEDQWEPSYSRGHVFLIKMLLEGRVKPTPELISSFYKCTLCGNCSSVCYSNTGYQGGYISEPIIDHVNLFEDLRADLVAAGIGPLPAHKNLIESCKQYDNTWFQPRSARDRWTRQLKNLKIKDIRKHPAEVLLFVGCTASFDQNMTQMAIDTATILTRAGVDFGILGKAEKCCGSPLLRTGVRTEFERLATENLEEFKRLGVKTIVTACSGCFKTIFQDYPKVASYDFEVLHTTMMYNRLIHEGKLDFSAGKPLRVTYHDPCHLGRAAGVYDEPRAVLRALPGIELIEMTPTRQYAFCCGAGGGFKTAFPELSRRIASGKVKRALSTGADAIVSACSFCEQNLAEGAAQLGTQMKVLDVGRLVAERLK